MNRQRALRITAWLAALAIISMPVVAVLNGWLASDRWPFRQLSVHGEFRQVSLEQIRAAASGGLAPGYFAVDLERVRADVAALPWVEHVEVRKRWPDQVALHVIEREAVAVWGSNQLLSARGDLFSAPAEQVPEGLPRLVGPAAQRREIWNFFVEAERALRPTGLAPSGVVLSDRGAWTMPLVNGGSLLLGRTDARSRLNRFTAVFQSLAISDPATLQRADLRYANGFALRWLTPSEVDAGTAQPALQVPESGSESATPPPAESART